MKSILKKMNSHMWLLLIFSFVVIPVSIYKYEASRFISGTTREAVRYETPDGFPVVVVSKDKKGQYTARIEHQFAANKLGPSESFLVPKGLEAALNRQLKSESKTGNPFGVDRFTVGQLPDGGQSIKVVSTSAGDMPCALVGWYTADSKSFKPQYFGASPNLSHPILALIIGSIALLIIHVIADRIAFRDKYSNGK